MAQDAEFLQHEPCPKCGSKDNLARYTNGSGYCFGCAHYEAANGEAQDLPQKQCATRSERPMLSGLAQALPKRNVLKATCEKWKYLVGRDEDSRPVHIATYCDDAGRTVAQKVRYADKSFSWRGDKKASGLFGQQLCRDGGRQVIVTEGEIDALSVSQVFKWPVVSIPDGAQGAARAFRKCIDFFSKFEKVVLLFDNDEHGEKAAEECAVLLRPGQAHIAKLPLKDANEMLVAERGDELVQAIWDARPFRPDGIVTGKSLAQKALAPVVVGLPWFLPTLTTLTFGRRFGEVYTLGAGTGVGKTDFLTQSVAHDLFELGLPVGVLFLEQQPEDTVRRIVGKRYGKRFHIPQAGTSGAGAWTQGELEASFSESAHHLDRLFLFDHFGASDWPTIDARLRYLVVGCGCRLLYIDHLTALAAGEDDERRALEAIMASLAKFAQEHGVVIHLVSHLATPEGKPHEEGGRVMIRHFKGSRAIGYWSHFMFGLERNQQADDEAARQRTVLRCLKDRHTGNATGRTITLAYNNQTGMLSEDASAEDVFPDTTGEF